MKILCVPGNVESAKSYPFWEGLYTLAKKHGHQVNILTGILSEAEIISQILNCDRWVSIDSFLPHLAAYHKLKPGIVIWGKSDPKIFGYEHNINLLKDRKYLRPQQFMWWFDPVGTWREPHNTDAFVAPEIVLEAVECAT